MLSGFGSCRGLDQNSLDAIAVLHVQAVDGRPGHADLVAQNLVARGTRLDQDALRTVAADDIVFLRVAAADGGIRDEFRTTPCWGLPVALHEGDVIRGGQGRSRVGVDGVDVVIADGVALDEVADRGIA